MLRKNKSKTYSLKNTIHTEIEIIKIIFIKYKKAYVTRILEKDKRT